MVYFWDSSCDCFLTYQCPHKLLTGKDTHRGLQWIVPTKLFNKKTRSTRQVQWLSGLLLLVQFRLSLYCLSSSLFLLNCLLVSLLLLLFFFFFSLWYHHHGWPGIKNQLGICLGVIHLSVYMSVCLSIYLIYLAIGLSVCLSVCICTYRSIYRSIFFSASTIDRLIFICVLVSFETRGI